MLTIGKIYSHYYDLRFDKKGHLLSYEERTDVAERVLNLCGYFRIITSEPMSASRALIHYKGRDISEKLFSSDKSFIGSKSMRVHYGESLSAKIFIEFIALIIRNKKQKVILSSFGLSDADIKGAAEDIGKKLSKDQSLLDGVQENDMEDDEDGTGTIDLFD